MITAATGPRMLIESIRSLLHARARPAAPADPAAEVNPVHLAACTLLLEVAYADGEFTVPERAHLESVLARHFGLDSEAGHHLIDLAERERVRSVDYYQFTSVLQRNYDLGQKMVLAEIMWGLVLADGKIAEREQYLTRKIANLLDLEPGYLAAAKDAASRRG
ncbi:MAG TPA: TerB family tellurite resistance protein [Gemmatimonadaceae bacterium]|nr:TerB family tellurite resistance protein [Gemmatimonadaceae bacterium]